MTNFEFIKSLADQLTEENTDSIISQVLIFANSKLKKDVPLSMFGINSFSDDEYIYKFATHPVGFEILKNETKTYDHYLEVVYSSSCIQVYKKPLILIDEQQLYTKFKIAYGLNNIYEFLASNHNVVFQLQEDKIVTDLATDPLNLGFYDNKLVFIHYGFTEEIDSTISQFLLEDDIAQL